MNDDGISALDLNHLPGGTPIGVSACLLGVCCKYNGGHNGDRAQDGLLMLSVRFLLIPVCPEQLGGLTTPRPPAEIVGGRVITREGTEVTAAFVRGAQETLALFEKLKVRTAILKDGSPSCGSQRIYDGTFTGVRIPGEGLTTRLLRTHGCKVYSEADIPEASF